MDNDAGFIRLLTVFWNFFGLRPIVMKFGWKDIKDESDFEAGVAKIISEVDRLSKIGKVSLIGCSAGGSVMVNVFSRRKDIVNKVIDICGALRHEGNELKKMETKAYLHSLNSCEKAILSLDENNKQKLLIIRPRFGDEFVKNEDVFIEKANNITIPTKEHLLTIVSALTIFSKKIFDFLKNYEK